MAKLLYGMRKNSERDLRAVCWVVFNRIESPLYPNSMEEVVNQSGQWVSYYPENPATAALTEIAAQEMENWRNGENRPFSTDTLWFNWSSEVGMRNGYIVGVVGRGLNFAPAWCRGYSAKTD